MSSPPSPVLHWVRACALGWLLGIPAIAALALAGEMVGLGGSQSLVGGGLGIGLGWVQARRLRQVGLAGRWLWFSVAGLTMPFVAIDMATSIGRAWPYSMPVAVALGGAIASALQAGTLARRFNGAWTWLPVAVVGWSAAAGLVWASDQVFIARAVPGLLGALIYLALAGSGGLILGLVTTTVIRRIIAAPR